MKINFKLMRDHTGLPRFRFLCSFQNITLSMSAPCIKAQQFSTPDCAPRPACGSNQLNVYTNFLKTLPVLPLVGQFLRILHCLAQHCGEVPFYFAPLRHQCLENISLSFNGSTQILRFDESTTAFIYIWIGMTRSLTLMHFVTSFRFLLLDDQF